jgi:hypothetical protein
MADLSPSQHTTTPSGNLTPVDIHVPPKTEQTPAPRPTRRRASLTGHTLEIVAGERRVKGYLVTRDELIGLGGTGLLATLAFSYGGRYINRSYDIQKDLELTQGLPPELTARWQTKSADDWDFGVLCIIVGIVVLLAGGAKVLSVIFSTNHPK